MSYPPIRDLVAKGISVRLTCWVPGHWIQADSVWRWVCQLACVSA
jgi:hypothetical protein